MKMCWLFVFLLWIGLLPTLVCAQGGFDPTIQDQALFYNEARTVYLGNLARRQNGVPPLRWNLQLTHATRWFSWDSIENRPSGFCGHQDTQGNRAGYRIAAFGYKTNGWAENVFCVYVTPERAIEGWMESSGHRDNLLDPNWREVGLGYYRRSGDGRGYATQDFGSDRSYPPVIIENEALATDSLSVDLYIYDRDTSGGFSKVNSSVAMRISNDPCFTQAVWEPYTAEKLWSLASGKNGWRSVYVQTRDDISRTSTVSDTIYFGTTLPLDGLGASQLSTTQPEVTLYGLKSGGAPLMQFSLGWLADDTFATFTKLWGNGERVNDSTSWGGTAYRLYPGDGESLAWVWDTGFIKDVPLTAYFRLKVNDNTSNSEVARISVKGGGTDYGPVTLKGTDFAAVNQYQEFPVDFIFNTNAEDEFLTFQIWRSGGADVYVDAISIFTAPQAFTTPVTWAVPGGNYRGQGVWVRYTDGNDQFSTIMDALTLRPELNVSPASLVTMVEHDSGTPQTEILKVTPRCSVFGWQVNDDASWLQAQVNEGELVVTVDHKGLSNGTYYAMITVSATDMPDVYPVSIPVTLLVVDHINPAYLPVVSRY